MATDRSVNRSEGWLDGAELALRPPPKLSLSAWADEHFYLSAESAAEPGRWRSLPYQRGILDAITDPAIERVSVMKSARVGYTKCINAAIAYHMAQDPCPILVVQPTVEDAEGYSKEEIAPMLRDCAVLAGLVTDDGKARDKTKIESTILHKRFPGGVLSMVGANSGRGFRRVSRRVVIFDEVDGYPPGGAGKEGDPIKLGEKRSEYYWNRKIVAGSTPLIKGASRIEELFLAGDQRRYHVPCPHCRHMDILSFDRDAARGHTMRWSEEDPGAAYFVCRSCNDAITEEHKIEMLERGEWIADAPGGTHASFHIWAAYSMSPNASWGAIAAEYIEAKKSPTTLRTFMNTAAGESFAERGEAPEWKLLYQRRESYPIGTIPVDPLVVTCGVDVQKDGLPYEVVGWLVDKQSFSIEAGKIEGDTALAETWVKLGELIGRTFTGPGGVEYHIRLTGIDSSYDTQRVYSWARGKPNVIALKGSATAKELVGTASPVDITIGGKHIPGGYRVYSVGVDIAKAELYGWLRIEKDGPGYCHFPEYEDEFFQQLTAEHLMTVTNAKTGRQVQVWHVLPNRPNHFLDCRVYARAAAYVVGLDKYKPPLPKPAPVEPAPPKRNWLAPRRGGWLK